MLRLAPELDAIVPPGEAAAYLPKIADARAHGWTVRAGRVAQPAAVARSLADLLLFAHENRSSRLVFGVELEPSQVEALRAHVAAASSPETSQSRSRSDGTAATADTGAAAASLLPSGGGEPAGEETTS
jgi:hypothetical protein